MDNNIVYSGITSDKKKFEIYKDGTCGGDIDIKCVFNHFQTHIDTEISKQTNKTNGKDKKIKLNNIIEIAKIGTAITSDEEKKIEKFNELYGAVVEKATDC